MRIRTVLFFLWGLLSVVELHAQTRQYMSFQGISLGKGLEEFVLQMETEGFSLLGYRRDVAVMEGVFAESDCQMLVYATPSIKLVWKVVLLAPQEEAWKFLENDYRRYKSLYSEKYGEPSKSFEFFAEPYKEGQEIKAVKMGQCFYSSCWEQENGRIIVEIFPSCRITFIYEDSYHAAIEARERITGIMEDI